MSVISHRGLMTPVVRNFFRERFTVQYSSMFMCVPYTQHTTTGYRVHRRASLQYSTSLTTLSTNLSERKHGILYSNGKVYRFEEPIQNCQL